jgi:hypothetical protein
MLASGKVLSASTGGVPGWRRARRSAAGLTQLVARRWSSGRRGVVAVDGGGAGAVVADDRALALHHGGREREVRWGRQRQKTGAVGGSPSV